MLLLNPKIHNRYYPDERSREIMPNGYSQPPYSGV
jgi:hypothetical protein